MFRFVFNVCIVAVLASSICGPAAAEVKLPPVFSDHMVLQRDRPIPIWGTAKPGEEVVASLLDQTKTTKAGADGAWRIDFAPLKAGGPHQLVVRGENTIEFGDVLVGEVWVGSGQSNMAGNVNGYAKGDETLAGLAEQTYPQLRLCRGTGGGWLEATPQNIRGFSALLFSFGERLHDELDVPVGLIVGAVGGTPSGRWLSEEMLRADEECRRQALEDAARRPFDQRLAEYETARARWQELADAAKAAGKSPPRPPAPAVRSGEIRSGKVGDLYAAHIHPVVPFAIRGVLWDQGEAGTAIEGVDQVAAMGALIRGWRTAWGQDDFPFLYVQKPSGGGCAWDPVDPITRNADPFAPLPAAAPKGADGDYRELHTRIRQHPNTAMVTARDLGSGIHPSNKSGYGRRAARVAFGFVYGREVEIYGPIYSSHKVERDRIRVRFDHVGQGLAWRHGEGLQGFEIAGRDGVYHWADAAIDGDSVVVSSDKVPEPASVRYAWGQRTPWANLFNQDGLPALTFQTKGE